MKTLDAYNNINPQQMNKDYKSINDTFYLNHNERNKNFCILKENAISTQDNPAILLDTPNLDYKVNEVPPDEKMDGINEAEISYSDVNKYQNDYLFNSSNQDIKNIFNLNDANSILQELLGKKTFRDPQEYAKILAKKHGDMKCEDIILDNDKYDKDIEMVMKYADSVHPFKVVIEFCQKFKWPSPEIDTFNIGTNENPQFKTTISIKNNTFKGEAVGVQKKIAKSTLKYNKNNIENAAINALTNLLEDPVVRDSLKMFVKGVLLKKEEDLRSHIKIKENPNNEEEEDGEYDRIKEEQMMEITEKEEKERVEKLLKEYYQNNPLVKLNFFKNKVKIPFSFTYSQKPKIKIATLYVGSEICKEIN